MLRTWDGELSMTPSQKFAMDLVDLSARIRFAGHRLKNYPTLSASFPDLYKSFADTVDANAKEVAAQ